MDCPLNLSGVLVAVTTPFKGNGLDEEAFKRHLAYLLKQGVNGLVPCGTTGEAATMTPGERNRIISLAVDAAEGKVPVIAGVGTNDTRTTLENAKEALTRGADGLLIVTPYYNKPPQDALYEHYRIIAEETGAPIVVYNVPGRTSVNLLPKTFERLSYIKEIVAIKDATGDLKVASELVSAAGDRANVLSGDDFTALPLVAVGGDGVISVVGNVDPKRNVEMISAALNGDYSTAQARHHELFPLVDALFQTTNPIPVKRAVSLLGFGHATVRSPLLPLDNPQSQRIENILRQMELL